MRSEDGPGSLPVRARLSDEELSKDELYIGRGTRKLSRSRWCNPFQLRRCRSRAECLSKFEVHARNSLWSDLGQLAGKKLLCHCLPWEACHGDVLVKLFAEWSSKECPAEADQPQGPAEANEPREDTAKVKLKTRRQVMEEGAVGSTPDVKPDGCPQRNKIALSILILFSGAEREASMKNWVKWYASKLGLAVQVENYDNLNGPEQDLCDEVVWTPLLQKVKEARFHAIMMMPPCSTFGCRRHDGGPPPLRAAEGQGLYGLAGLKPEDAEKVRVGNLCAINAAAAAEAAMETESAFLLEQPWPQADRPHMTKLTEWKQVLADSRAKVKKMAQCGAGADHHKPTMLAGTVPTHFAEECEHPAEWHREVPSGKWLWTSHPPLRGKLKAVKASEWKE